MRREGDKRGARLCPERARAAASSIPQGVAVDRPSPAWGPLTHACRVLVQKTTQTTLARKGRPKDKAGRREEVRVGSIAILAKVLAQRPPTLRCLPSRQTSLRLSSAEGEPEFAARRFGGASKQQASTHEEQASKEQQPFNKSMRAAQSRLGDAHFPFSTAQSVGIVCYFACAALASLALRKILSRRSARGLPPLLLSALSLPPLACKQQASQALPPRCVQRCRTPAAKGSTHEPAFPAALDVPSVRLLPWARLPTARAGVLRAAKLRRRRLCV